MTNRIMADDGKPVGRRDPSRVEIGCRVLLAFLGGYALTYAATAALARLLPVPAAAAVIISSNLSFALYPAIIIWAFAARDIRRLTGLMAVLTLVLLAVGFGL